VVTSALAFAANTSAGLTQTWLRGTDEWQYHTAFAARNGFVSAQLAAAGALGAPDTLEGVNGFDRAFAGAEVDSSAILGGLGTRWAIDEIALKPYPACAFNQASIQQLLALCAAHNIRPGEVDHIVAYLTPEDLRYPGVDNRLPVRTRAAALMCLRTCLAIAMLHGDITLEHLERADVSEVRALVVRIELKADPSLETHTSFVEVTAGCNTFSSGRAASTVYDAAVSDSLVARLQPLTGMNDQEMDELVNAIQTLDTADDIDGILRLIRASAGRLPLT
jgi:2-methylcitrate dehydratase PrpD